MSSKLSWKRLALQFVIMFLVVFGILALLSFSGLESYGLLVVGAVAGATMGVLNLLFQRRSQDSKP
jgi:predicted Na+-dependent transporter